MAFELPFFCSNALNFCLAFEQCVCTSRSLKNRDPTFCMAFERLCLNVRTSREHITIFLPWHSNARKAIRTPEGKFDFKWGTSKFLSHFISFHPKDRRDERERERGSVGILRNKREKISLKRKLSPAKLKGLPRDFLPFSSLSPLISKVISPSLFLP